MTVTALDCETETSLPGKPLRGWLGDGTEEVLLYFSLYPFLFRLYAMLKHYLLKLKEIKMKVQLLFY